MNAVTHEVKEKKSQSIRMNILTAETTKQHFNSRNNKRMNILTAETTL